MQRLLLVGILGLCFQTGFSQVYVNDVAIDSLNPYCQLICDNAALLARATIVIDFGQKFVDLGTNRQKVTGPDGRPVIFNSPMHALNFMARNGWELISAQVIGTAAGQDSKFVYLLRRKRTVLELPMPIR